jgi:repressor LexA
VTALTAREAACLDAILATRDRGYPPSVRELATILGVTSTSSVAHTLAALTRKGRIRRGPGARCIEVLDEPPGDTPADAATRTITRLAAENTAMRRELTARGLHHAIPKETP